MIIIIGFSYGLVSWYERGAEGYILGLRLSYVNVTPYSFTVDSK